MTHNLAWPGMAERMDARPAGEVIWVSITTRHLPLSVAGMHIETRRFFSCEALRTVETISADYRTVRFTDGTSTTTSPKQIWHLRMEKQ